MATIQAAKAVLRKDIKNKLNSLSSEEKRKQADKVLKKLFALPIFQKSKRISVYLSTDNEINTEPIVKAIFDFGKTCFVPRYQGNIMEMVKLHSMKDWQSLPLTKWNIKQPKLSEERDNALKTGGLDMVIVPGVGFTCDGQRLGHGKGYYDAFLTRLKQAQNVPFTTVALAFKEQIQEDIPAHNNDVKIDIVLYAD